MRELERSPEYWAEKRRQHVRSMGLDDEIKYLIREEIEAAWKEMPQSLTDEEKNGYEVACNAISKRLLAL